MASTEAPIRAGLIFQQRQSAEQLKRTLREAGIDLAVELDVEALRAGQLDQLEVEVYIVNLESELEDMLDEVTELLEATVRPVVYNDAGVSSDLSGWDQARWARHLAAKIRKGRDLLPPAPVGAKSIPMPMRAAAPAVVAMPVPALSADSLADAGAPAAAIEADPPADLPLNSDSLDRSELPEFEPLEQRADDAIELGELDLSESLEGVDPIIAGVDDDADQELSGETLELAGLANDLLAPPAEPAAAAAIPELEPLVLDDDLELGLDLPQDLYQEERLEAIGGDRDQYDLSLDDLSVFEAMDDGASDLLEVLDAPADGSDESFEADELDALFNDDLAMIDEPELTAIDEPGDASSSAVATVEMDALDIFEDLSQSRASGTGSAPDTFAGLDELLANSSQDAEPAHAVAEQPEVPASGGYSLPDLSDWVLEPLDGEFAASAVEAAPSIKPESMGLDLRDLASTRGPVAADPVSAGSAGAATGMPKPIEMAAEDDLADLDLGIDFLDLELAPEPEADSPTPQPLTTAEPVAVAATASMVGPKRVVILGASIGGPDSIRAFLKDIKPDLRAAFVLVQHMGAEFLDLMAQQLDRVSPLRVHLASHGRALSEGEVLIAPVGKRLKVDAKGAVDLAEEAGATAYSPSIDQVLTDSLQRWGADRLLVIIFSGMANDAVAGSRQLAAAGVPIWAQDPASCVISSMVDGVVAAKVVSFIGTPEQLAAQANRLLA